MKRRTCWINVFITATALILTAHSPCRGQTWDADPWSPYYSDSSAQGGDGTTYAWTTRIDDRDGGVSGGEDEVLSAHTNVRLTTWVDLADRTGSISRSVSAYSYTCEGVTWEWTGAPGTAPAQLLLRSASVKGYCWVYGEVDDSDGYPTTNTYIHSYAGGYAANYTYTEDYNEASAYTEGWAYSLDTNGEVDADSVGLGDVQGTWYIYGPGYYGLEIYFDLVEESEYETASGLSGIDASVGIVYLASSYGTIDAPSEHYASVGGYSGTEYDGYSEVYRDDL